MTRDIVNVSQTASAPPMSAAVQQTRGSGFEKLIRSSDEPDGPTKVDETTSPDGSAKSPDNGVAALLGVPGFFVQAATDAIAQASDETSESLPAPAPAKEAAQPSGANHVGARTPATTMAAAIQAQVDGLAAGKATAEVLAEAGIVRLHGKTVAGDVVLGKPGQDAAQPDGKLNASAVAATGTGGDLAKQATGAAPKADVSEALKAGTGKAETVKAEGAIVTQASDTDVDPAQTGGRVDAGAAPDAVRPGAPVERIQTLQTSAAPATPSAQSGQPVVSGTVAAAVQVANEIASHAASRRSRFEIQLDPGDLGRVDVRLDIAHDGRVATRLIVERPETLDMLRNDARELSRTLEQAGFQLGQGGLAFQLKDGRQPFWGEQADRSGSGAASDDIEDVAPVAAAYSRSQSAGAGGVDVKV